MTDIVDELRAAAEGPGPINAPYKKLVRRAANKIEDLREKQRIARHRARQSLKELEEII